MPLRICFASAEMAPFAKAGGLADVSGALVKYLHAEGHDIRLVMPAYSTLSQSGLELQPGAFHAQALARGGIGHDLGRRLEHGLEPLEIAERPEDVEHGQPGPPVVGLALAQMIDAATR